jgi:tRNA nucleotidyltransferase (CCA-adding enzyme)
VALVQPPPPDVLLERLRAAPHAPAVLDAAAGLPGVHVVGGTVRDVLLGAPPGDLDLVVEGDGLATAQALGERLGADVVPHDRFLTATVLYEGRPIDVATARTERYPAPGALPEVEPASLAADLRRRDVTVNAAAVAVSGARPGALAAVPGALEDLGAGVLRILHPESFGDDPTRLLRVARYAGRLGFSVEPGTAGLARAAAAGGALDTVTGPRVGAELLLLAAEPSVPAQLEWCGRLGLDAALHPGFAPDAALAVRTLALLPADALAASAVLGACSRAIAAGPLSAWLDRLGLPADVRDPAVAAAARSDAAAGALAAARRPSEVAAAAAGLPPEAVAVAGALGAEAAARAWLEEIRHVELAIDGGDLLAAGVEEGPAVGRGLAAALAARLDGAAPGREAQLRAALAAAGRG